jgi:hypothetical protein
MVVETDLELIKDAFSAEDIKSDSKTFRESNRRGNLKWKLLAHRGPLPGNV